MNIQQQSENLFWLIVNDNHPYRKFINEFSKLTDLKKVFFHQAFKTILNSNEYTKWLQFLFEEDLTVDELLDEDYEDDRIGPYPTAHLRFAERIQGEILRISTALPFLIDYIQKGDFSSNIDKPTILGFEPLKWKGQKNELVYIFTQLLSLENNRKEIILSSYQSNLARFLIANFDIFNGDSFDSVRNYFKDPEKLPKNSRLTFKG